MLPLQPLLMQVRHPVHLHLAPQHLAQNILLLTVTARRSSLESNPEVYSNATMAPDFDLIEQNFQTIQSPCITSSFLWFKGHPDNITNFDKLPLPAQFLNVEADDYASTFQAWMTMPKFITPVLPSCPAVLRIQSCSVTSQYKIALIDSCLIP